MFQNMTTDNQIVLGLQEAMLLPGIQCDNIKVHLTKTIALQCESHLTDCGSIEFDAKQLGCPGAMPEEGAGTEGIVKDT